MNELLDYINTRMEELEEEKEELKEYQEKDKDRRCLEYALYQRDNLLKGREGDVPIFNTGGYLYLAVTR